MTDTLETLYATLLARRDHADPATSYAAQLFAGGAPAIARKVGEEAVETVIAALTQGPDALARESADLLFHLCALWAACGVTPADVMAVLDARAGTSGLAEKAARGGQGLQ